MIPVNYHSKLYCIVGKFSRRMFGEFAVFKHLAEKSLANEQICQRVINCKYYLGWFLFGESQTICQTFYPPNFPTIRCIYFTVFMSIG